MVEKKHTENIERYVAGIVGINNQSKPENVSHQVWEGYKSKQVNELQKDLEIPEEELGAAMDRACQDMLLWQVLL